jgi:hypothetical protein
MNRKRVPLDGPLGCGGARLPRLAGLPKPEMEKGRLAGGPSIVVPWSG